MKLAPALIGLAVLVAAASRTEAAPPHGVLDVANAGQIGGWARDPDNPSPIAVHIYIDGELAHDLVADGPRPDLPYADKNHGFSWKPPPLGPGNHQVIAYGIGVTASGALDGQNVGLTNSPSVIAAGCAGLANAGLAWCQGVASYYVNRAADTHYLYNSNIRVGVNRSFGGTIFELYGPGHNENLLTEHGGGAVQLSIWGYEPKGPSAWFGQGAGPVCDPTPYPTEAACKKKHASCREWCCSAGAHIANCGSVKTCVDWGAGAPWNPIQAQGASCGWDTPTNDVDVLTPGAQSVFIRKTGPYHFTKSTAMSGVVFEQTTKLHDAYVQIDYRVTYSGPYTLNSHPQEIPAVFPGNGMTHTYYFYAGAAPYSGAAVDKSVAPPSDKGLMFRLKDRGPYPHSNVDHYLTENWVSVCDASGARCLTLAVLSPAYREIAVSGHPGSGYGYLTPLGGFNLKPGFDEKFTAYLFPYRYDHSVGGKTVRKWIYELAASSGCLAHGYPCDDGNPCTASACDGHGKCQVTVPCPAVDAGGKHDSPATPDGGSAQDAPRPGDGPAASASDASPDAQRSGDGGGSGEAASRPSATPGGCACRVGPAGAPSLLLELLVLLGAAGRLRRRR